MDDILSLLSKSYNQNVKERENTQIEEWKIIELEKFIHYSNKGLNRTTLDLGSGNGLYAKYLQDKGYEMRCIDISEEMITLTQLKGVNAQLMDISNLTFQDSSFDNIWSLNTILHIPSTKINKTLDGIKKVMKKDGILYLGSYGGVRFEGIFENDRYSPKRFFSFYEDKQLISIVEKYFEIIGFESKKVPKRRMRFQSLIARKTNKTTPLQEL